MKLTSCPNRRCELQKSETLLEGAPLAPLTVQLKGATEKTEALLIKLGWVIAAVVAYGLLRWRLMDAIQGSRVRAAYDADPWAKDLRIPEYEQRALQGMAGRMYHPLTPWLVVLATLVVVLVPSGRLIRLMRPLGLEIRNDIARLKARLVFAAVATSPLACLVVGLVLLAGNSATAIEEAPAAVGGVLAKAA